MFTGYSVCIGTNDELYPAMEMVKSWCGISRGLWMRRSFEWYLRQRGYLRIFPLEMLYGIET